MTDIYSFMWLAIGGVLRFFDFGRWTIPLAAWLAPVFLIHFARLNDPLTATVAIWLIMMLAGYFALRGVIPLTGVAYPIFIAVLAALWTLPYLAARLLSADDVELRMWDAASGALMLRISAQCPQ